MRKQTMPKASDMALIAFTQKDASSARPSRSLARASEGDAGMSMATNTAGIV